MCEDRVTETATIAVSRERFSYGIVGHTIRDMGCLTHRCPTSYEEMTRWEVCKTVAQPKNQSVGMVSMGSMSSLVRGGGAADNGKGRSRSATSAGSSTNGSVPPGIVPGL